MEIRSLTEDEVPEERPAEGRGREDPCGASPRGAPLRKGMSRLRLRPDCEPDFGDGEELVDSPANASWSRSTQVSSLSGSLPDGVSNRAPQEGRNDGDGEAVECSKR